MPIAWNPKRWGNFCMPEDEKKKKRFLLSNTVYTVWAYWNIFALDVI